MLGFQSAVSWALAFTVMVGFPSAVNTAPVDDTSVSHVVAARAVVPWEARHRLTSSTYQSTFNQLVGKGYRLTCVSGYTINNDPRFAAIWDKVDGPSWVAKHGLTSAQYQTQFNTFSSQGYRPIFVDGYTVGGSPQFAAIWDKSSSSGWVARHDLTPSQYQTAFDTYTKQGYRLKHVTGYASGSQVRYAAIWEKSSSKVAWVTRHGLTSAQYQQYSNQYVAQGYRPIHVDGYVVDNVDYFAAIWDKSSGPWVARHGLSSTGYQNEVNKWVGQGYRVKVVSGYTLNSNQDRYAAIFVK